MTKEEQERRTTGLQSDRGAAYSSNELVKSSVDSPVSSEHPVEYSNESSDSSGEQEDIQHKCFESSRSIDVVYPPPSETPGQTALASEQISLRRGLLHRTTVVSRMLEVSKADEQRLWLYQQSASIPTLCKARMSASGQWRQPRALNLSSGAEVLGRDLLVCGSDPHLTSLRPREVVG